MKKQWNPGELSKAICENCGGVVEARFEHRTYPLTAPRVNVPEVLVAVCTACDSIVAVPYQSSIILNRARKSQSAEPVTLRE